MSWDDVADRVLAGGRMTREEALAALLGDGDDLLPLLHAAGRVRARHHGREVLVNVLQNARSGGCSEDCTFCSQSSSASSGVVRYPLRPVAEIVEGARRAAEVGADTYCIVTSLARPSARDLETIGAAAAEIKERWLIRICCSLGLLTAEQAGLLARTGVDRYNHNLETSERFFPEVCSTHRWSDRAATVRAASAAGLEVCCGGIVGLGETEEDRVDLAFALRDLDVRSIPVNFLDPRPGTPLADRPRPSPEACLRALALVRLANPQAEDVRAAGGREACLGALQPLALFPASSIFAGGYLTTPGQGLLRDVRMIREAGFTARVLHAEPPGENGGAAGGNGRRSAAGSTGARGSSGVPAALPSRADLEAWDDAHVWHPFTPHSVFREEDPFLVAAGEGPWLIDPEGRRHLDGVASLWCSSLGHRRPEIDAAIRAQLDRIAHATMLGNSTIPAILLARRLVGLAPPGLTRVFYSDDGSTANEVALKMAYQAQQQSGDPADRRRTRFVALGGAYHGDTVGAVSVGGIELFHERFRGLVFDVLRSPSPHCYRCPLGKERSTCSVDCAGVLEDLLETHGDTVAAVILEPGMQGAAGIVPYPDGFLRRAEAAARRAGAFLVLDEVAVGMGRSGSLFASDREGLTPDFLSLAKGLTGGYLPLAATLTTEAVFERFLGPPEEGRTFFHGHTFTGNPLGAAAALAVLDVLERDRVVEGVAARAERLAERLETLREIPAVGDVRQYGLAAGIELVADRAARAPFPAGERRGMRVCRAARDRGVFLRPLGDVIVVMPPLTIAPEEIDAIVDAIAHGIRTACPDAR